MNKNPSFFSAFFSKKTLVWAMVFSIVLLLNWAVVLPKAQAALNNAVVTIQPTEMEFKPVVGHQSSAAFAVVKFGLKDADATADDTLDSVTVTVKDADSSGTVSADFTSLTIVQDSNGDGLFTSGVDTQLGSPQTTVNIGSATAITADTAALSGSATSTTYFVVAALAANSSESHKFTVDMATNGVVVSGSAITVTALTGQSAHLVDNTAPVISGTYPANNDTNVPVNFVFHANFTEASELNPSTVNSTNITFTKSSSAVPFSLKPFPNGFELVPSGGAPTFAAGARWAKPWNTSGCFAEFRPEQSVNFDCNTTFTVGDMVFFQHENMPPEMGIITNNTLTGGTFAVNGFSLWGPQKIMKFATPDATGAVSGTTAVATGDLILVNSGANPNTNYWYDWAVVTAGAAINSASLRLNGASAAPTFETGSSFSAIIPDATAVDNGATAGGTLAVVVGDLVYAQLSGGSYGWHIVTTAGDLSSDSNEGTAGLDGLDAANSLVAASSQMSKITPAAQGAVTDDTQLSSGDIIFTHTTANASDNGSYNWHFISQGAAVNSADLRLDNAPANLDPDSSYIVTIGTGVKDSAGNPLASAATIAFTTSSNDPTNVLMPPQIKGSSPSPGVMDFPINADLYVEFPAGDDGDMLADGSTNAINNVNNVLLQTAAAGMPSGANICASGGCTLSWDSTNRFLKISPASNLSADTDYVLTLKANIVNSVGLAIGNPGNYDYLVFFKTAGSADTTSPTFESMDPKNGAVDVMRNLASVRIQFPEAIDASTIAVDNLFVWKDDNGDGVKDAGESLLTISRDYDAVSHVVHLGLQALLDQNTKYCVKATTAIKDVAGNAMASDTVKCFTTINAAFSASAPTVMYADADTFRMWIEFDQPVDFTTGPFGALNKQNYTIENPVGTKLDLNSAVFAARPEARGVEITGLALQPETEFKVTVKNVKEVSGSLAIVPGSGDTARGTVMEPGAGDGFGMDMKSFDQKDFSQFGMNPERCGPISSKPEKTSNWRCEFPAPSALATGSQIIITFPAGFDVTNANVVPLTQSWDNKDIDGPGPGTTTITGTSTSVAARAVTLTLTHSGDSMSANQQLRFELQGIVNPSSVGEYRATAIVKDANGVKIGNTISFAPFDIFAAGSYSISGTVCKSSAAGGTCGVGDTGISGINVFLDSFRGMDHESTTTDANGNYTFTQLTAGDYGVSINFGMDTTALAEVGGGSQFKQVTVSDGNLSDVDFKMVDLSSTGKTLTATVSGLPANEQFDLFCHSSTNFEFSAPTVKAATADANGAATVTLKLQPNTTYECGIGPHIPFESMTMGGPPPMPDFTFMPPPPRTVAVADSDVNVSFTVKRATHELKVKVVNDSNSGIANVFVDAWPVAGKGLDSTGALVDMQGGFGKTKADGTAIVPLAAGTYSVKACAPGMPCPEPVVVDVKDNSSNADSNTTADIYKDGSLLTGDGLAIRIAQSGVTVQGQLQDENGEGIAYGWVDVERVSSSSDTCSNFTSKGEWSGSPTDSNGNFTIYVPPHLASETTYWLLRGHAPAYGEVGCEPITIAGTSKTGQNLRASSGDFGEVVITAKKGGTEVEGAFVECHGPNGGNQGKTGPDGTVTLKMKAGTYACGGDLSGAGPLTQQSNVTVSGGGSTAIILSVGNPGTVTLDLGSDVTDALCGVVDSAGQGDFRHYEGSQIELKMPAGDYTAKCDGPTTGFINSEDITVTAGQTTALDWTNNVPTLYSVSGRIIDADGNNLSGATVVFTDQTNGRKTFIPTSGVSGSSNNVSVDLPAGTYSVQTLKAGYNDSDRPQVITISANTTIETRTMAAATANNVSATIVKDGTNAGQGRVIATRDDGKVAFAEISSTASGANASLSLPSGTWTLEAKTPDGRKSGTSQTVVVNSSGVADSSPTLTVDTAISGFTAQPATVGNYVPSVGTIVTHDDISGLQVQIDPVSGSTDTTGGTVEMRQAPDVPATTSGAKLVGETGYQITPKDANGKEIHTGASGIVKIPVTTSDLVAALPADFADADNPTAEEITAALEKTKVGHLNALGDYEQLPTTSEKDAVTADTHLLIARTTSFSDFAPVVSADNAPDTPSGLAGTADSNTAITLTWAASSGATSYDIYRDTSASGSFSRVGSEPTVGAVTTYQDTGLSQNTTYYYKISAINNSGESAASSAISVATKNEGGGLVGGGGGGVSTPLVVGVTQPTAETETKAEKVEIDVPTAALNDLTAVAGASYENYTITQLSDEVKKAVSAISVLAGEGELVAEKLVAARAAVKNLLVGIIRLTLQKVKVRLNELLSS